MMVSRKEIYERHRNRVDALKARLERLHEKVSAMEAIYPHYAESITSPRGGLSSSEALREKIDRIMAAREKQLDNLLHGKDPVKEHKALKKGNEVLEKTVSELEKKVEEVLPEIRRGFTERIATAESYEEEQQIIMQHKKLLDPAEIKQVVSEVRGRLINNSLNDFLSREPKDRGELTEYWITRFGRRMAGEIARQAVAIANEKKKTPETESIDSMLSKDTPPEEPFMETRGDRKPLAERFIYWMGKADDSLMGNLLGKDTEEAHELLDALDAMKGYDKAVKDFTSRVGEKDWNDVLEIARAINRLKKDPERLTNFIKQAEETDFDGALRLARNA